MQETMVIREPELLIPKPGLAGLKSFMVQYLFVVGIGKQLAQGVLAEEAVL